MHDVFMLYEAHYLIWHRTVQFSFQINSSIANSNLFADEVAYS